jgi:hypothetical protein
MTPASQKLIFQQALSLPKTARKQLARKLVLSLRPADKRVSAKDWMRAWEREIRKREVAVDLGKARRLAYVEALASLRARF